MVSGGQLLIIVLAPSLPPCMCVCVLTCGQFSFSLTTQLFFPSLYTHTHTHTQIRRLQTIYVCLCVCARLGEPWEPDDHRAADGVRRSEEAEEGEHANTTSERANEQVGGFASIYSVSLLMIEPDR